MIDKRDIFSSIGLDFTNEIIEMYKAKQDIKVLDVGCGSGYSVNCLSKMGFDATGIDFSEEIVNLGKEKYKNVNIKVMDANNLDFPQNYFDLILFECSLSVMKDPEKILSDCKELLKKDGLILLSDFFFKETNIDNDIYTMNYWNRLFSQLDFKVINFQDKSTVWKNYLGMVLWEYGELSGLLRGNQNCNLNKNILNKETGYFLVILRKRD